MNDYATSRRVTAVAMVAAIVTCAALTAALRGTAADSSAADRAPLPVVVTAFDRERGFERERHYLGTVRAAEETRLSFETGGTLASLNVREGDSVAAGDVLATLDASRLRASLAMTRSEIDQLEADLELARLRRERQNELRVRGLAAEQALDEARLAEEALAAQLAARRAALDALQVDLRDRSLRAPFDGRVAGRHVNAGAAVSAGTPVLTLVSAAGFEAHVGVPVERARALRRGEAYAFRLGGVTLQGSLRALRPDVDPVTLTVDAVFALEPAPGVFAGDSISLVLAERIDSEGGWLPLAALVPGERGLWTALRLSEGETPRRVRQELVEVVSTRGQHAFVRGTLPDGALVIADGVHRVVPGSAVAPIGH